MSIDNVCRNCGTGGLSVFYEIKNVPVHSVLLLPSREAALNYPTGDITLGFCHTCGFISNVTFDPTLHEYSSEYESTQAFSATFNAFHRNLAQRLIERHDLHGKDIIEIGCGQGEFLTLLCDLGNNRGIGFDPAYGSGRHRSEARNQITFIKDFYSEEYAHYQGDFFCCKMTLEHIQDTADFVRMVRRAIGGRTHSIVFFQVPNVSRILRDEAFWDIYYEHCSYFSPESLTYLFEQAGFEIIDLEDGYDDQYLMIEAKPTHGQVETILTRKCDLAELTQDVANFAKNSQQKLDAWRRILDEIRQKGQRAVIWGAGSKGVAFLTTLKILSEIEYAVDINPFKHGTCMAGTGQKIVAPEFLQAYRPDVVIVMNPIYCDEIQQDLNEMEVTARLMPV